MPSLKRLLKQEVKEYKQSIANYKGFNKRYTQWQVDKAKAALEKL